MLGLNRPDFSPERRRGLWTFLESMPTPRRNVIIENLRLQQVYDAIYTTSLDIALQDTPIGAVRRWFQLRVLGEEDTLGDASGPVRIRLMLQQLGPTYVKIGQMMASRGDVLPAEWVEELSKLQSEAAPFAYDDDEDGRTARLRHAQTAALALPQTGMVVTLDCGDPADIHPVDKKPVGQRLARLALARHYGEAVACCGPRPTDLRRLDGGRLQLLFDTGGSALLLASGGEGFEIAGEDGSYVPAVAVVDGNQVELHAAPIERPVHVRYAWAASPPCSLHNADGLPAAPFRVSIR